MTDPVARLARFQALVDVCSRSYREWRLETLPFSRPLHDLAMLLLRLRVDETGVPASPGSPRVLVGGVRGRRSRIRPRSRSRPIRRRPAPIDAAWLADITSGSDMYWRGDRLDQFAFGQRVFTGIAADAAPAAVVAIRAFPRQRMLMLTLERMGIRTPAVYASIARQAKRLTEGSPNHVFWTLAQVQSALALVARMTKPARSTPRGRRTAGDVAVRRCRSRATARTAPSPGGWDASCCRCCPTRESADPSEIARGPADGRTRRPGRRSRGARA